MRIPSSGFPVQLKQGGFVMDRALDKLIKILASAGMNDDEFNMLLGRFLEEEAFDYVECMIELTKSEKTMFADEPVYEA